MRSSSHHTRRLMILAASLLGLTILVALPDSSASQPAASASTGQARSAAPTNPSQANEARRRWLSRSLLPAPGRPLVLTSTLALLSPATSISPKTEMFTHLAGGGTDTGDGILATQAKVRTVRGINVGPDGGVYLSTFDFDNKLRRVGTDGLITTVAGALNSGFSGDGGPAPQALMNFPLGNCTAPDGSRYVVDFGHRRIRRVGAPLPGFTNEDLAIASEDGSLLYRFNKNGRHLSTVNALTGAPLLTFNYDAQGRLASIQDADNNTTTIERNGGGNPTALVGPFGGRTMLTLDANGFLASLANPAGETTQLVTTSSGRLTRVTGPRGNVFTFTYDALGRLTRAEDQAGSSTGLTRTEIAGGHQVTSTSALNRTNTLRVERLASDEQRRINTSPDGTQTTTLIGTDEHRTTTLPDGTTTVLLPGPDPRFRMHSPITSSQTITLPSGLKSTLTEMRTATLADPTNPLSLVSQTETVNFNGRTYTSTYAAATRTFTSTTPQGRQTTLVSDTLGRPVQGQVAGLEPVGYTYDSRGRLASITKGSGGSARTTTFTYNPGGFLATLTNALGQTTSFGYDSAGRVTSQTLPDGRVINFGYNANGKRASITPPGRPAQSFTYDPAESVTVYTPPNVGAGTNTTQYTYNADRQVTRLTHPDGAAIDYSYDGAGRLSTITHGGGAMTYSYNATTGRLTGIAAPGGIGLSYTYDGSLLMSETLSGPVAGSVSQTYDSNFRNSARRSDWVFAGTLATANTRPPTAGSMFVVAGGL